MKQDYFNLGTDKYYHDALLTRKVAILLSKDRPVFFFFLLLKTNHDDILLLLEQENSRRCSLFVVTKLIFVPRIIYDKLLLL